MKINIVERYHSLAMQRMGEPIKEGLEEFAEVVWSEEIDPEADLNYHMPWHFILEDGCENTKNAIMYTHVHDHYKDALGQACSRADVVFAMSHKGKAELMELGVPREKIWVTYCGSNHVIGRQRNIGVVAAIQPDGRKRTHILLDLVWKMDKRLLPLINFVLLGFGWEDMVKKLKSAGATVSWTETVLGEDLIQMYHNFDLLISPGYIEGGPLPVIEAMRCGVPVLASPIGYAADFLGDESIYNDVDELVEKVNAIMKPRYDLIESGGMLSWNNYAADHSLVLGRLLNAEYEPSHHLATGRYAQIFDIIDEIKPQSICEIGTWNGHRASQMIQQAQKHHEKPYDISYYGFDLFEEMTEYAMAEELSKWPPSEEAVMRYLKPTGADIGLRKGNTRETLAANHTIADFYYIDGGHSEVTIASDWHYVSNAMHKDSVALFDDYYEDGPEGMGCNRLVDGLDPEVWKVEILPHKTEAKYNDEGLFIRMVKVTHA